MRLLIGAVIGAGAELFGLRFGWFDAVGQICLWLLPALFLAVALHELGHLAAAFAVGFRFREFAAGPIVVRREASRLRWHFAPSRMLLLGGQVQAVPESSSNLNRRFLIVLAGGPVATALVFAAVPLLPAGAFRTAMALANLLCAGTSWLPYYAGGYVTDAKGLLLLGRGGPEGDLLGAMLYVLALDTQGVRPRDWDPATVRKLEAAGSTPLAAAAAVLRLCRVLDGGTPEEIAAAAESALPQAGKAVPLHRRIIFESSAYAQALYRRNAALATAWLNDARRVKGVVAEPDWDADLLGAIALASGNPTEAHAHFARALARLDRQPGATGSVAASRVRLLTLLQNSTDIVCK